MASRLSRLSSRLEALDAEIKKRVDSIDYPQWLLMPTNEGARFLIATVLLGLASLNTGNNLIYLIFGLMLSILFLDYVLVTFNIRGIRVAVMSPGPLYAKASSLLVLRVENVKGISSYSLRIRLPEGMEGEGYIAHIPKRSSQEVRVPVRFTRRGEFTFNAIVVQSGFPFIFFTRRRLLDTGGSVTVYPEHLDVRLDTLASGHGQGRPNMRQGEGDELISLRDFREGDDRRSIHWKASARASTLMVREFAADLPRTATVVLDDISDMDAESFERAVSLAASSAEWLINHGYHVALLTSSHAVPFTFAKEGGYRILDQLAGIRLNMGGAVPALPERPGVVVLVLGSRASGMSAHIAGASIVKYADTV